MIYKEEKVFAEESGTKKIIAIVKLDDVPKNGCCSFKIGAEIYRPKEDKWIYESGGCQHEAIRKHFPHLGCFIKLHLSDCDGIPLYPIENGIYHVKKDKGTAINYLRITEEEYVTLRPAAILENKLIFKYLLFYAGVVERWQYEATRAILYLEELTGEKWIDPYPERQRFGISDEERDCILLQMQDWGRNEEMIAEQIKRKKEKQREFVMSRYANDLRKINIEKELRLILLDMETEVYRDYISNVIFYDHRDTICFNWMSGEDKIPIEVYNRFIEENKEFLEQYKIKTEYNG